MKYTAIPILVYIESSTVAAYGNADDCAKTLCGVIAGTFPNATAFAAEDFHNGEVVADYLPALDARITAVCLPA